MIKIRAAVGALPGRFIPENAAAAQNDFARVQVFLHLFREGRHPPQDFRDARRAAKRAERGFAHVHEAFGSCFSH